MDHFKPPPEPSNFALRVATAKLDVELAITDPDNYELQFPSIWGEFKGSIAKATRGKCGYCEMQVIGGQDGDVEHYFPKSEIWKLSEDAADRGEQEDWTSKVRGRKQDVIAETGFWWRAYDWTNYLLSCLVCNRKWKLAYFPFAESNSVLPPKRSRNYKPLVLNPFEGPNPIKHLEFGPDGEVKPRDGSPHGQATIDVCGLDRIGLRRARMKTAKKAHALVSKLNRPDLAPEDFDELIEEIYEEGNELYAHSGVIKTVLYQLGKMTWAELEEIVADIRGQ